MAKWNQSAGIIFNDNDGKIGWTSGNGNVEDYHRYQRIFGKWRARWIAFKWFWLGIKYLERANKEDRHLKKWVFKAEIPE